MLNRSSASSASYVVGIDLGTTNTELAYWKLESDGFSGRPSTFEIPQFVSPAVVESRATLPSTAFVDKASARESYDWKLPWESAEKDEDAPDENSAEATRQEKKRGFFSRLFGGEVAQEKKEDPLQDKFFLVGEIAKSLAAERPEQIVVSAKSWLTCSKVDRRAPILPWGGEKDAPKISPLVASQSYLKHLVDAWNYAFPYAPFAEQSVILTIPASFDESAKELTREAAIGAGIDPETLLFLEEPQAALYAWLAQKGEDWRKELKVGDVVLVCDVGGGTTDLSLIRAEEESGELTLNRLAVGDRLLLGGDNVDLAIAYRAAESFKEQGVSLNPWQSFALRRQCRLAKERALDEKNRNQAGVDDAYKITVEGRSSRLVGDALSVDLSRQEIVDLVLEGFLPICSLDDAPKRRRGVGVREIGLPYESDPAITRHIARFLRECRKTNGDEIKPTYFLLNGGFFKSKLIERRLQEQLEAWFPDSPPRNLCSDADLVGAVSNGAAFYGKVKLSGGVRIHSATPRSYYIGIESSGLAVPGVRLPLKALCVAPFGMEEGTEIDVPSDVFELVVGEPAVFRFFSSTTRPQDEPGAVVDYFDGDETSELKETTPIETTLGSPETQGESSETQSAGVDAFEYVGVRFRSRVTELGALEIWCEDVDSDRRWKLEFSVREE